jgi:hypothetical protein
MEQQNLLPDLVIDATGAEQIRGFASWARFLSIVGFIICGLIVLAAIFAGSILTSFNRYDTYGSGVSSGLGVMVTVIYLIFAAVYFIPTLFLFQAATKLRTAIQANDQWLLNEGFTKLKASFRFWGILTIVILSFYVLMLIFGGLMMIGR